MSYKALSKHQHISLLPSQAGFASGFGGFLCCPGCELRWALHYPEGGDSWLLQEPGDRPECSHVSHSLIVTGKVLEKGRGLKELLSIPNSAMVVALEPYEPGMWLITVGCWQTCTSSAFP